MDDLKSIVKGLTDQDIENDISLEIYSAYGGSHLNYIKVSEIKDVLDSTDREVNIDFHISKRS